MTDFVIVLMRWLHISSAVVLVGGLLYARAVLTPAGSGLGAEQWHELAGRAAERFRFWVYLVIPASLISGLYAAFAFPGHSTRYRVLLGLKVLLAAHIFATALLVTANKSKRPARAMAGAAVSGFVVIAIAAYLRRIF